VQMMGMRSTDGRRKSFITSSFHRETLMDLMNLDWAGNLRWITNRVWEIY
jgi:hypothetical protein